MGIDTNQAAVSLQSIVIFLVAGLIFLWVVSEAGKQVLQKLQPVMIFLVAAALVGAVVVKMIAGIF